jgi:hypothetical protein
VAEFYLAPSLEITALWSALFKSFSPASPEKIPKVVKDSSPATAGGSVF